MRPKNISRFFSTFEAESNQASRRKRLQRRIVKMVKVVFPHFEDKSLDRWMAAPGPVQTVGGVRVGTSKEVDLSEALKRFHIASNKNLANRWDYPIT